MGCVCGRESVDIGERRFHLKSLLGEGGFSTVHLVNDALTHKPYALKKLTCHSRSDEEMAQRECDIQSLLSHPGLCPLEAFGTVVDKDSYSNRVTQFLLVMPVYRKGSLQDMIDTRSAQQQSLQEHEILSLFSGICDAVYYMHTRDPPLAHRDLKPGNVMLSDDLQPVIMDFGSANKARHNIDTVKKARYLEDQAGERCSMLYRAPELFAVQIGAAIDERTDVWSLGCLLYALCYLESPFDQAYSRGDSVALAVNSGNVRFPNDKYSRSMKDLITSLMKVDPAQRPYLDEFQSRIDFLIKQTDNRV